MAFFRKTHCCTNLIDFYQRIGALPMIRFHRHIHFRDEGGKRYDLYGMPGLPARLAPAGFQVLANGRTIGNHRPPRVTKSGLSVDLSLSYFLLVPVGA